MTGYMSEQIIFWGLIVDPSLGKDEDFAREGAAAKRFYETVSVA